LQFAQFSTQSVAQKICLYDRVTQQRLLPVKLNNAACSKNTSYCMNTIWKYGNFQYNGVASMKPVLGEVVMFLTQDEQGLIDYVAMLNANKDVQSQVRVEIDGAEPVDIILYDDPNDVWKWDRTTNRGNFTWTTKPSYTDGVVIGHINFIDNYCVRSSYTQTAGAINTMSILSGSINNVQRIMTQGYMSGQVFEFCQYPVTQTTHVDATCPGSTDGSATIGIVYGPSNVEYRWYNSAGVQIGTAASISGLGAGVYHVLVNDTTAEACNANRQVTIIDHTLLGADVTTTQFACTTKGSASASPLGGSGGFTYAWFNGAGTQIGTGSSISNLNPGNYKVRITDNCGSVKDTDFVITSVGCCGDNQCSASEGCGSPTYCAADCGTCCPAGTYVDGTNCVVCPPGSRSTVSQAPSCTSCPANTFNAGGNDACEPCPANYFSTAGSGKCVRCPAGQVRGTSEASCHTCGNGKFAAPCDSTACATCAAGTYATDGAYFCSTCPAGTFSAAGASSCSTCAAGTYSASGASSCTTCPTGLSSAAGATHLLACA
jgi:hypothetical protein